ncbi:MAG TPA: nuclear transport factor 2 family protein, partial [Phenylobacterium sp.]|nr:nuclear transport factor 2 family protein [Phenylobacterium sp.]
MTHNVLPGAVAALALGAGPAMASPSDDARTVAALDTAYQAAVERNDADSMARILHPQMILVVGDGRVRTGEDLVRLARSGEVTFEHQVE